MTIHNYEIAESGGTLVNIETLTDVAENWSTQSQYYPAGEPVELASGGQRLLGSPYLEWRFAAAIPADMLDELYTIYTAGGGEVDIRSIKDDYSTPTYVYFHATMIWPAPGSYEHYAGYYSGVNAIRFVNLVEYTP